MTETLNKIDFKEPPPSPVITLDPSNGSDDNRQYLAKITHNGDAAVPRSSCLGELNINFFDTDLGLITTTCIQCEETVPISLDYLKLQVGLFARARSVIKALNPTSKNSVLERV